jgi:hypothetical protein
VNRLYEKTPTLPKKKAHRSKWTPHQQDLAARWESQAVMVEGYLVFDAVKERQEACNCGSTKYVDYHLWLASTPSASRARAMVVEVSPREWAYHQGWNKAETFRRLIRAKERPVIVAITIPRRSRCGSDNESGKPDARSARRPRNPIAIMLSTKGQVNAAA